jgi:ABC-type glycerol-3-phosphate transport system substrate-binding protein
VTRALALLPFVLVLAACGGGPPAATTTTSVPPAAKKTLHVAISADGHHPQLGHTWTYEVRVTDAATGKPVPAHVHLQFTFGGSPVGEVGKHVVQNGVWKETIPAKGKDAFPPASVGPKLQLRATVTAPGYKPAVASYPIQVVK